MYSLLWNLKSLVPRVPRSQSLFGNALVFETLFRTRWVMRSRYRVLELDAPHFITATCVEWLPVLRSSACSDIVVRAFAYAQAQKGLKLFAWVILDSHLHAIVGGPELAKTIGDLKRFAAREILTQLEAEGQEW